MTGNCCVIKLLRGSMDGKHLHDLNFRVKPPFSNSSSARQFKIHVELF